MPALSLPKGNLIFIWGPDPLATPAVTSLGWRALSDHNRQEVDVGTNRFEDTQRMANGTLRKFYIKDKKTFNVSWTMLPAYRTETVDGKWGAEDLRQFYQNSLGQSTFKIKLNFAKGGVSQENTGFEEYTVSFTNCNFTLVKRGVNAYWNISLSMEEV